MWTSLNLLSRIYLYALICICNQPWEFLFYENLFESFLSVRISSYCVNLSESLFYENLFESFLSVKICSYYVNLFEYFFIVKIFLNPSCLWKSFLIYAHLWESLLLTMFWHQFWNAFFEGAILKCLHVLKCIFWASNYFNILIYGCWFGWLLLYAFMTAD